MEHLERLLICEQFQMNEASHLHRGWTPFYFIYDPKCSSTFPLCTINAPAAFAWCTINAPAVFAWCTNQFVLKVEFSYRGDRSSLTVIYQDCRTTVNLNVEGILVGYWWIDKGVSSKPLNIIGGNFFSSICLYGSDVNPWGCLLGWFKKICRLQPWHRKLKTCIVNDIVKCMSSEMMLIMWFS